MELIKNYWVFIAVGLWIFYKWYNSKKILALLPELKKEGAILIDVRSPGEFNSASAPGTINIPLNELKGRIDEIPQGVPIVVCCATGTRSGMARMLLKKNGYQKVYNIGAWTKL